MPNQSAASSGDNGSTPVNPPQSNNDKLVNALLFKKDLNEVHLLIDLVSGRADRSLSLLSMPDPEDSTKILTSTDILKRIARMRYPPDDSDEINASNATILLMTKDRLSALADPARAYTIAYTIFTNSEYHTLWSYLFRRIMRKFGSGKSDPDPGDPGFDLSRITFPGLEAHASRFRYWRTLLICFAIIWLWLTALTLWDASLGRTALDHADQNWRMYIDAARDNPELLNSENDCDIKQLLIRESAPPSSSGPNASGTAAANTRTSDIGRMATACRRLHYRKVMTTQSSDEIENAFGCNNKIWIIHTWCWYGSLSGTFEDVNNRARWQLATSKLSVYTTYMLPMMFALLGTLIGAFRAILNKIGNSSLAPRDLAGMLVGMPVGLVAGFAVGLFFAPSALPIQGAGAVDSTFSLSASGLGFLAGYASQSFFSYIDNLVGTMFPSATSGTVRATAVAVAAHDALTSSAARAAATGTPPASTTKTSG